MYKLFYYPRNASWAPHIVLEELGIEYELELVDRKKNAQKSLDYLKLNPTGRIPTLLYEGRAIFESAAIAMHLIENYPHKGLLPQPGSSDRALCYQWLFYLTSTLQPELMLYFYPEKHTSDQSSSVSIAKAQEYRVTEMLGILNEQIDGGNYLVGNQFTICDCFLFMLCHWAGGFKKPPLEFENLGRCLKRLAARDSIRKVCVKEGTDLSIYQ